MKNWNWFVNVTCGTFLSPTTLSKLADTKLQTNHPELGSSMRSLPKRWPVGMTLAICDDLYRPHLSLHM